METKDFIIYNGMISAARRVFENVVLPAGEYSAKDVAKNLLIRYFYKDKYYNYHIQENELITIEFDGFKCKFPVASVFDVCAQIETAWNIPSARRAKFVRAAEDAAPVVSFDVPAAAKAIINAVAPAKSAAAECCKFVCVDTKRRAVVTTNGHVLAAVAVPDMYVSQDAEIKTHDAANGRVCVDPSLFKTGKGNIIIDAAGNAANGAQTRETFLNYPFPSWEKVLPAVSDDGAVILGKDFSKVKKAILSAAKYSNTLNNVVVLRGVAGRPELEIIGYKTKDGDEKTADQTQTQIINLSAPVPVSFVVTIDGKDINAVPAVADKMYICGETRPVIFTGANCFALLMPVQIDKTPWHDNKFSVDGADDVLYICNFPALGAENSAAAVAAFAAISAPQDAPETTGTGWADSLPAASVSFEFDAPQDAAPVADQETNDDAPAVASVPAAAEETDDAPDVAAVPDSVPVAEDAPAVETDDDETDDEIINNNLLAAANAGVWGVSASDILGAAEDAPDVAAQKKIQNSVFMYHNILPGLIMQHKHDENIYIIILDTTNKGYKTKEITFYPNSRKRPNVKTAYFFKLDIQPGGKSLFDVCPVSADILKVLAAVDNETRRLAAPVAEDAPAVPAEDAAPVAVADSVPVAELGAQDAPDAPAVVSLPVATVPAVWYAVYQSGKLENIYFSKLLADELVINSLFVAGETKDILAVPSPDAAPAEFPRQTCPLFAAVSAEDAPAVETSNDETDAPQDAAPVADSVPVFASVFAIMPEIWQTSKAEETDDDAPAVAEDAAPVWADSETDDETDDAPAVAVAASFARRFRRVWHVAAAFVCLLILSAAPRLFVADSVPASELGTLQRPDAPQPLPCAVPDSVPVDNETGAQDAPDATNAAPADSVPAVAKKRAQTGRKRARRVAEDAPAVAAPVADSLAVADSVANVPAVVVPDSVPVADSLAVCPSDSLGAVCVADSVANVPAVADSLGVAEDATAVAVPADSVPVADQETDAPAVSTSEDAPDAPAVADSETDDETDDDAPQDAPAVPAGNGANGAPAVPVVSVPVATAPAPAVPCVYTL